MKTFMKIPRVLLLTLLFISTGVQASNECPDVKGSPIKRGIDNDLVYFGGDSVACYFDQANDVMIRVEDTPLVPKLSIFYKSSGKSFASLANFFARAERNTGSLGTSSCACGL